MERHEMKVPLVCVLPNNVSSHKSFIESVDGGVNPYFDVFFISDGSHPTTDATLAVGVRKRPCFVDEHRQFVYFSHTQSNLSDLQ
jgi:hypothetical protein